MILFIQITDVDSGDKLLKTTKIAMQADLRICDCNGNFILDTA